MVPGAGTKKMDFFIILISGDNVRPTTPSDDKNKSVETIT